MNTLNACAYTMPELWQVALGVVVALIILYEMRQNAFVYAVAVVVVGIAAPLFTHNFVYMAAAILISIVIAAITRWNTLHSKS